MRHLRLSMLQIIWGLLILTYGVGTALSSTAANMRRTTFNRTSFTRMSAAPNASCYTMLLNGTSIFGTSSFVSSDGSVSKVALACRLQALNGTVSIPIANIGPNVWTYQSLLGILTLVGTYQEVNTALSSIKYSRCNPLGQPTIYYEGYDLVVVDHAALPTSEFPLNQSFVSNVMSQNFVFDNSFTMHVMLNSNSSVQDLLPTITMLTPRSVHSMRSGSVFQVQGTMLMRRTLVCFIWSPFNSYGQNSEG
jgi:hypothetical protein